MSVAGKQLTTHPLRAVSNGVLLCLHVLVILIVGLVDRLLRVCAWVRRNIPPPSLLRPGEVSAFPAHVGLLLDPAVVDVVRVCALVGWCSELGIAHVTIHDAQGKYKRHAESIAHQLRAIACKGDTGTVVVRTSTVQYTVSNSAVTTHQPASPAAEFVVAAGKGAESGNKVSRVAAGQAPTITVLITSRHDGTESVLGCARAAVSACRQGRVRPDDLTVAAVDNHLATNCPMLEGVPEVELGLHFSHNLVLEGFLPWHIRLTEFKSAGSLAAFTKPQFHQCLREFARVEQRFGR